MRRVLRLSLCAMLLLIGGLSVRGGETALDRYIATPDAVYGWQLGSTVKGEGCTSYILELTSQSWRSPSEVDRPVWKHWLNIVKPDRLTGTTGFLIIGGGNNRAAMPADASQRAREMAVSTHTVIAELSGVPNQPLVFPDAPEKGRSEDDLIAYSRVRYIDTHDPNWLVRLAMVKSGVRAMDAIQEFLASDAGGKTKVDKFVVTGGSKRGWTTWLVGAVDPRVVAIIPTVIDALNSEVITRHHYEAYGFFSTALNDYVRHGLFPDKVGTPEYQEVLAIEDPYNYRDRQRLKIPKFMVNSAGDQYFLPDNSTFYYADLPEEKYIRYVPNTKHNLAESDARESIEAFYQSVLDGRPRPKFSWKKEADGSLRVTVQDKPTAVNVWYATNPDARDFRLDTIGKAYKGRKLVPRDDGTYSASFANPPQGFTAFFIELTYDSGGKYPLKFTTETSVVPDVLPFKFPTAAK